MRITYNVARISVLYISLSNMIRIEDYQEGSIHTVQEGDSSSSSGIASNASVHTELQHHDDEGVEYDLDIPDHALGFPQFPSSHQGEGI
jgi:hypothetical protein